LLERSFNNQKTRKCDALRVFCFPAKDCQAGSNPAPKR
jgi:hypothetical protein